MQGSLLASLKVFSVNLLAGSISGCIGKVCEYPFDTVKVLQQTQGGDLSAFQVAKQAIDRRGVLSLYKGMSSPIAGAAAENAVLFASYGWAKKMLGVKDNEQVDEC